MKYSLQYGISYLFYERISQIIMIDNVLHRISVKGRMVEKGDGLRYVFAVLNRCERFVVSRVTAFVLRIFIHVASLPKIF